MLSQLRSIFDVIVSFKAAQEALYEVSLATAPAAESPCCSYFASKEAGYRTKCPLGRALAAITGRVAVC